MLQVKSFSCLLVDTRHVFALKFLFQTARLHLDNSPVESLLNSYKTSVAKFYA